MFMFKKLFAAAVLGLALAGGAGAAVTTTIKAHVQTQAGAPVVGADVIMVNYGYNGPTSATQWGQTDAQGDWTFTSVSTGTGYTLYFNKQGYSPTIRDQFNNPDPSLQHNFWPWDATPLYSTFTVANDQTEVGQVQLPFTGATVNKVLFGSVNYNNIPEPGFFGMVQADPSGAGTLTVDNVPYAEANTYNIGIYDPEQNRGINRNISTGLN
nr:carboxypeptidase-like regulatory domain-containing protein [Elusimicrobiota bacterium]